MKKTIILILSAFVAFSAVASAADLSPVSSSAVQNRKKADIKEVTFKAKIHCANCVKKLQENLSFEKGVKDLHICLEDQIIYIKYDAAKTNEETLKKAIIKLGVPVLGVCKEGHQHNHK